MNSRLEGKTAVVTGGGQGIGEAIVRALAREGADVVINDLESNVENTKSTATKAKESGRKIITLFGDVSNHNEVETMVQEVLKEFKKIDILVNNSGIARPVLFKDMTENQWDEVMDVNLKGVFNCCRAVVGNMIENRSGRIIMISALGGRSGLIGHSQYCAAMAGGFGLTKSLAKELARYRILVNAVLPGYIETPIQKAPLKYRQMIINECPLKRAGKPEEVAAVVTFLASDEASYITGSTIEVGGGLWL
jgi:3-oxoacyl-[acyl-carrier protein] reductase